ncbi:DUF433 domain-containing protein [Spirosoma taeanense]|uniref:DUF433 domain-containing protein n=1 Tax=Spirosoma taeanense TaxID=2735870 RepID=A0A6M5YDI5_9BACT|nr:DUF433 domain-containing protein [Spirosoma taeanense]QJW92049.1 DUF433 domain-containing protein [Spirosoma taeanense]
MNYKERITSDHQVMLGKPVIKGTRITVELVLRKLSEGASTSDLMAIYPNLQEADVLAALNYASDVLANEEIIMLDAA